MWQDYAKARGLSTQSMTQQQKIEAEYLGIMEETAGQVGNAAEAANTLAGAQATTSKSAREMAIAFGSALSPAVELVNTALAGITGTVKEFITASPALTAGLSSAAVAIGGFFAASKAITALGVAFKSAASGVTLFGGALSISMPWLVGIAAAIGLAVTAYTAIKKSAEAAAEAEKKANEARKQEIVNARSTAGQMRQLADEYTKLSQKENQTYKDKARMREIEKQVAELQPDLAKAYGISGDAAAENAGKHRDLADGINAVADASERVADQKEYDAAFDRYEKAAESVEKLEKSIESANAAIAQYQNSSWWDDWSEEDANAAIAEEQAKIDQAMASMGAALNEKVKAFSNKIVLGLQAAGKNISDAEAEMLTAIANAFGQDAGSDFSFYEDAIAEAINELADSGEIDSAIESLGKVRDKIAKGIKPDEDDVGAIEAAYKILFEKITDSIPADMTVGADEINNAIQKVFNSAFIDNMVNIAADSEDLVGAIFDKIIDLADENAKKMADKAADGVLGLAEGWQEAAQTATDSAKAMEDVSKTIEAAYSQTVAAAQSTESDYKAAMDKLAKYSEIYKQLKGKDFAEATDENADAIKALSNATGVAITDSDSLTRALTILGQSMAETRSQADNFKFPALQEARDDVQEVIDALKTKLEGLGEGAENDALRLQIQGHIASLESLRRTLGNTITYYEEYAKQAQSSGEKAAEAVKDPVDEAQDAIRVYKSAADELAKWQNMQSQMQGSSFAEMSGTDAEALQKISDALGMVIDDEESFGKALDAVNALAETSGNTYETALEEMQEAQDSLTEAIKDTQATMAEYPEGSEEYKKQAAVLNVLQTAYNAATLAIDEYMKKATAAAGTTKGATQEAEIDYEDAATRAEEAFKRAAENQSKLRALYSEFDDLSFEEATEKNADALGKLSDELGMSITNQDEFDAAMSAASSALDDYTDTLESTEESLKTANDALFKQIETLKEQKKAAEEANDAEKAGKLESQIKDLEKAYNKTTRTLNNYKKKASDTARESTKNTRAVKQEEKAWSAYGKTQDEVLKRVRNVVRQKALLDDAMSNVQAIETAGGSLQDVQAVIDKLPKDLWFAVSSFDQAKEKLSKSSQDMSGFFDQAIADVEKQLQEAKDALEELGRGKEVSLSINGKAEAKVDTSQVEGEIARLRALLSQLQTLASQTGSSISGGGGGGGGGGNKESEYSKESKAWQHTVKMFSAFDMNASKKELAGYVKLYEKYMAQLDAIDKKRWATQWQKNKIKEKLITADELKSLQETIHNLEETARREAFDNDMAKYDHAVAMGRMSTKKQIEYLQKVLKAHKLSRDERWQIEEQIYDLQQELAEKAKEKEEKRLDDLKQKAKEALEKQKEHAESIYDQLVDALRNRYEKERDLRKKALSDQIAALEAEQNAEDEARARQEYEQELAEKQRELRIEKSARRRREIQEEINEMILEEERRLSDKARQERIDALNAEIDAVDSAYDELTSDENLNREALTLAMSGNMKAMETIIKDYTPKFQDAGSALMDYLTTGITNKKTTLLNTLSGIFDDASKTMQKQLATMAKTSNTTSANVTVNLSIGQVNEASDYQTVTDRLQAAIRSATRG